MHVAVIGGGTMGAGIAHRFAANGATVLLVDFDAETAARAVERVGATLSTAAARGKLNPDDLQDIVANVSSAGGIGELPLGLDLIVEAVIEDVGLKQKILVEAMGRSPVPGRSPGCSERHCCWLCQ